MKNGIYLEHLFSNNNCRVHYKNNKAYFVESPIGSGKQWTLYLKNGKRHRLNGPALEYNNGDKYWFVNDVHHRLDGPAVEYANGNKLWYIEGKNIKVSSQKEFEQYLLLQAFQ